MLEVGGHQLFVLTRLLLLEDESYKTFSPSHNALGTLFYSN